MSLALLFWVLMLFWAIGRVVYAPRPISPAFIPEVLLFVLLLILGWHEFGPAVHP